MIYRTDARTRRRPTSIGPHRGLWAATRRLARGNWPDFPDADEEHDDDHLSRRRPVFVTSFGAVWRALRPLEQEHVEAWMDSEWGKRLREAADARRAARRGKNWRRGWNRMPDAWPP